MRCNIHMLLAFDQHGSIQHLFQPRRATLLEDAIVSISAKAEWGGAAATWFWWV